MKSLISYIIKRNLYHIIFCLFILVIDILLHKQAKTLEMRMKFIAYAKENEERGLRPAQEFIPHIHGFDGHMKSMWWLLRTNVFTYPFLFWGLFGVSILQMWYFTFTNYKFYSWDFLIYVIIILLSRAGAGVGMFGGGWVGGIILGLLPELTLFLFTSLFTMRSNPKIYSSGIHYPSLITLVICCIIISLLAWKGFVDIENEINKAHKHYSKKTGFISYVLNKIHKTDKSTAQFDKSTQLQREKKMKEWFGIYKEKEKEKGNTVSETIDIIKKEYFWAALGRGRVIWEGVDPSSVPLTKTILE